jgi:hypothetical protein
MGGGCIGTRGGHSVLWVVVVLGPKKYGRANENGIKSTYHHICL